MSQDNGFLQDYAKAQMWFNPAAAIGIEGWRKGRDIVAEEMTSDQLAEAQKIALEMVEANPKLMSGQGISL